MDVVFLILQQRLAVKTFIGITQDSDEIEQFVVHNNGKLASVTELGPFLSKSEAVNWLEYLKSKISDIEEVYSVRELLIEDSWYGFTFEQDLATLT